LTHNVLVVYGIVFSCIVLCCVALCHVMSYCVVLYVMLHNTEYWQIRKHKKKMAMA